MFTTPYTFNSASKSNFEAKSLLPHMTVPDMSYTIPQLMQRFASGNDPLISKKPLYDENPTFDTIDPTRDPAFDYADYTALTADLRSRKTSVPSPKDPVLPTQTPEKQPVTELPPTTP